MAYSKDQWERAKAYYEGGLSLAKIKDKTGIARNTISQRAKKEQWEHSANADYIEAKEIIAEKKGTISEQSVLVLDEIADERIRDMKLIKGLTQKNLHAMGDKIGVDTDFYQHKAIQDTIDKAAITLGVADRHAPKIDVTQLQQQTASSDVTVILEEDKAVK